MTDFALELINVVAGYGPITAVNNISLKLNQGEIVALIGANGAGKTSTLMTISGLLSSTSGKIFVNGKDISETPPHIRIGMGLSQVPEGRKIFPRLTVKENLYLGSYLRTDKKEMLLDYHKVCELFPILKERAAQLGGTLSGGEQQMLAIGRALMGAPKILMMDEPSMGVAPILVAKIFEVIRELNRMGLSILLVEQNANAALTIAKRGYVMETGRIVCEDSTEALLSSSTIKTAYLGQ